MKIYQGSVLSPFLSAAVVDAIIELANDGVLSELLCGGELELITIDDP